MSELGDGPLNLDRKPPSGIGRKALELLDSLPEKHRSFNLRGVSPEDWWMV